MNAAPVGPMPAHRPGPIAGLVIGKTLIGLATLVSRMGMADFVRIKTIFEEYLPCALTSE
jgi:hypothetical protein